MRVRTGIALCLLAPPCLAAPGEVAQAPVTEATGVQPNILLVLDDSGSMDWEDTLNKGVEYWGFSPTDSVREGSKVFSSTPAVQDALNARLGTCRGFNVLAYNPTIIYEPWPTKADETTAGLESLYYLRWDDDDDDGEYDLGECGYSGDATSGYTLDTAHRVDVSGMSAADKTNYANWFHYYRSRMRVAKAALSGVVSESSARVGLHTIHQRNERSVGDVLQGSQRQDLLDAIFAGNPSGSTPLRNTLERAGDYFSGNDSPILDANGGGMCQQNYAVVMSDGYWNGGSPGVDNVDGTVGGWVRASDSDTYANTLADVAMKYYKTDLSILDDEVPIVPGVDENTAQHLVTYTVGFGVNGTLDDDPSDPDASFAWPQVTSDTATTVDDMRHAAWNARGQFLSAADPQALVEALSRIAKNIAARSASTGSLEVGGRSKGTDTTLIQTTYDPATWQGDVVGRPIDGDGVLAATPAWSLADWLADLSDRHNSRHILTFNADSNEAFAFEAANIDKLSKVQAIDLGAFIDASVLGLNTDQNLQVNVTVSGAEVQIKTLRVDIGLFTALMDYLKGDAQHEGDRYRARNNRYLGDIIHSLPAIVGAPAANYRDDIAADDYSTFRADHQSRTPMAYVGANDGMLHAIDMATGVEKFAFMPHGVFSAESERGVRQLAAKDYVHHYYVDASPVVRDAYVDLGGGAQWHSLLLGGLGGGGKSVYLLDVTDPDGFDTLGEVDGSVPGDIVKWEFDHADLGYSVSDIQVAKLADGNWYAIFGNGYNADSDGRAKLFIVDLADASNFTVLDTGKGSISGGSCLDAASDCNGLASPELADIDADGVFDWAYAGDLHGNVWTFDLSDFDTNEPNADVVVSRLFQSCATPLSSASPSDECAVASRQPITTRVALARNPAFTSSVDAPNLNVYWGTGQLIALGDQSDTSQQVFYSVLHRDLGSGVRRYHDELEAQAFTALTGVTDARTVNGVGVDYKDDKGFGPQYGWYLPFADSGERLVTTPAVRGDLIVFNSTVPGVAGPCSAGASGWLNAVSLRDGIAPSRGVDYVKQVFDYNQDGKVDDGDDVDDKVVLSVKVDGEPTAPKFNKDSQFVGLGGSQDAEGGVDQWVMDFGVGRQTGRSAWYQLR